MADTNFSSGTVIASTWLDDANTSTYPILNTVAGTNAITATGPSTLLLAYPRGTAFRFLPVLANTGAVTINISGIGVVALTKYGTVPLVAGDLQIGMWAYIAYDGTRFQLINPRTADVSTATGTLPILNGGTGSTTATAALIALGAIGRLIGVQTFTANATYTPTTGTNSVVVYAVGGGGGGGGCQPTVAGQHAAGGGGGGGSVAISRHTTGFSGANISIGSGGNGVFQSPGQAGGATVFGAGITIAQGGGGGLVSPSGAIMASSGGGPVAGSVSTIITIPGTTGASGWGTAGSGISVGGEGGGGMFGPTTPGPIAGGNIAGTAAGGRGCGGSGGASTPVQGGSIGGVGSTGIVIVYEYS